MPPQPERVVVTEGALLAALAQGRGAFEIVALENYIS